MILAAVPLCDKKAYCQTVALDAIQRQDFDLKQVALFIDLQTADPAIWDTAFARWFRLREFLADAGSQFAGYCLDWWWDNRDGDFADENMAARIRPITLAREKARVYALNRVMWKGWIEQVMPKPGVAGTGWYSPVSETDGREITHIWYVDADVAPPPDALRRLLALDAPLVSGVFYGRVGNKGKGIPYVFQEQLDGHYGVHYLRTLPSTGVVEADFVGAGCLLVREDVFRRIGWRHWKLDVDPTFFSEDYYFCRDVERAGFGRVKVIADLICQHHDPSGEIA